MVKVKRINSHYKCDSCQNKAKFELYMNKYKTGKFVCLCESCLFELNKGISSELSKIIMEKLKNQND